MNISKNLLKQIINEELKKVIDESDEEIRNRIAKSQVDYDSYIKNQYTDKTAQGGMGPNYNKQSTKYDKDLHSNDMRRQAKIIWNQNANHEFFASGVSKFHFLGYAGGLNIERYFEKSASKNELSAIGVVNSEAKKDFYEAMDRMEFLKSEFQIAMQVQGRVTWAGDFDAFTEQLKDADPDDIKKMSSSGLSKRPGRISPEIYSNDELTDGIILDAEDAKRNADKMGEIVVDNWKPIALWVNIPDSVGRFLKSVNVKDAPFNNVRRMSKIWKDFSSTISKKQLDAIYKLQQISAKMNVPFMLMSTKGKIEINQDSLNSLFQKMENSHIMLRRSYNKWLNKQ
jgi:hypothetical protein